MKRKTISKLLIIFILLLSIVGLTVITINIYHTKPMSMNRLDYINLIEDGSFETLNVSVGDCCTSYELRNEAMINVSRSNDSFHNRYSLNLTSSNHCACINKQIRGFENTIYLISFYYKGDNPKFCNWVVGDDKCLPVKKLPSANQWTKYEQLLIFTNNSESAYIYFYAD